MLFLYENDFLEVLRENCYPGVYTFCADDAGVLNRLSNGTGTMAEPVQLLNHTFAWALHIPDDRVFDVLKNVRHSDIEVVDRITAPALAFAYDYITVSESEKEDGQRFGDYGYCWPEEIEATRSREMNSEDPPTDELIFVPIWTLPAELTGAPRVWADLEGDDDDENLESE